MQSWRNRKTLILGRTEMMGLLTPAEYNQCVEQAYRIALQDSATIPLEYERALAAGVGIEKKMIST